LIKKFEVDKFQSQAPSLSFSNDVK